MNESSLQDLYVNELRDLYSAETQLVEALPKITQALQETTLRNAVEEHLQQTKEQVKRLEQIFRTLYCSPIGNTCEAMKGLLLEGDEIIQEFEEGPVRDAALIGAAQRMEHYEMAGYGTVRAFAEILGNNDHATLLHETYLEEVGADETFSAIAEGTVNPAARESVVHGSYVV